MDKLLNKNQIESLLEKNGKADIGMENSALLLEVAKLEDSLIKILEYIDKDKRQSFAFEFERLRDRCVLAAVEQISDVEL